DPQAISLSVSIVTYNTPSPDLVSTLDSLLASIRSANQQGLTETTLYLINNSTTPMLDSDRLNQFQEAFAAVNCELRLLQGHGNIGYGSGHNLSINPTNARYHLLMNPDVILHEDSLAEGISYLEAHSSVVIVAPFVSGADNHKQYLCKRYPTVFDFLLRALPSQRIKAKYSRHLAHFEMHELSEHQASHGVPIVSGCFMLCRADKLKQTGGFDEKYFLYFEDFDLSLRMGKLGELAYLPAMKIRHFGGNSSRKGMRHILMFLRSGIRFFNTYGWRFIQ
ncbi:MAG: glycosyltransferase, partial [Pseudohongiellaceae bacterium]